MGIHMITPLYELVIKRPAIPIYLYPNGPGDETNIPWVYPPGTEHWLAVRDLRKNAYSWHVGSQTYMTWDRDLYTLDPLPPGAIDFVNIRCWGGQTYGYHVYKYVLKMPGVGIWESAEYGWAPAGAEPPREGVVEELLTNPITSAPWARADFDTLQLGVSLNEKGSFGRILINWLYLDLVGVPPP